MLEGKSTILFAENQFFLNIEISISLYGYSRFMPLLSILKNKTKIQNQTSGAVTCYKAINCCTKALQHLLKLLKAHIHTKM